VSRSDYKTKGYRDGRKLFVIENYNLGSLISQKKDQGVLFRAYRQLPVRN